MKRTESDRLIKIAIGSGCMRDKAQQRYLEQPCETGVSIRHMLSRAPGGVCEATDDQAQCAEGLVDLDALLELLPHCP